MRRIQLIVAVAAMMVAMLSFSVPAMADVDLDDLDDDGVLVFDVNDLDDIDDLDDLDDLDDIDGIVELDDLDHFDREGPVHLID
jgi:glycosyltransferase A (GT-A) superfamily protein (DUF2064 family)